MITTSARPRTRGGVRLSARWTTADGARAGASCSRSSIMHAACSAKVDHTSMTSSVRSMKCSCSRPRVTLLRSGTSTAARHKRKNAVSARIEPRDRGLEQQQILQHVAAPPAVHSVDRRDRQARVFHGDAGEARARAHVAAAQRGERGARGGRRHAPVERRRTREVEQRVHLEADRRMAAQHALDQRRALAGEGIEHRRARRHVEPRERVTDERGAEARRETKPAVDRQPRAMFVGRSTDVDLAVRGLHGHGWSRTKE